MGATLVGGVEPVATVVGCWESMRTASEAAAFELEAPTPVDPVDLVIVVGGARAP